MRTAGLSTERLITQLEVTTATDSAGRGEHAPLPCGQGLGDGDDTRLAAASRRAREERGATPTVSLVAHPPAQAFPLRRLAYSAHRSGSFRPIGVRLTRGNRRSAPHRLWPRTGVADASCHLGAKGAVDSRSLPMAPLCLGSPWRSATERLGASSMGFDMARYCHYPSRTGSCAYRRGLAGRSSSVSVPAPDPGPRLEGAFGALGRGRRGDAPQRRVNLSVI